MPKKFQLFKIEILEILHKKDAIKNSRDGEKLRFFAKTFKTSTYSVFMSFRATTLIHGANHFYLSIEISWHALYMRALLAHIDDQCKKSFKNSISLDVLDVRAPSENYSQSICMVE